MQQEETPKLDLGSLGSFDFTPDWAKQKAGVSVGKVRPEREFKDRRGGFGEDRGAKKPMGKKPFVGSSADIVFDSVRGNEFYLYGTQVADIKCEGFTCRFNDRGESKKLHFAAVVFSTGGHTYDYICDIPDVKVGDMVIVNTPKGEQKVEVVRLFDKDETETALPIEKYKYIIRKA